jgi:DNA-binding NarL/FixJ family response regulator
VTSVLMADDHPVVRQGLRAVLDAAQDIDLVAEADNGPDAVRLCVERRPDVVLMDLQLPGLHGIEATRQIRRVAPETAVLVLTMFDDDDTVFAAVSAGAIGYLLKGSDGTDIVAAIRSAAAGQAVFGAALAKRLQSWFLRGPSGDVAFPELTERERSILDGVAAGLGNAEIGAKLFLSPKTVANNVTVILDKLHLANRVEAIVKARDAGLGRSRDADEPALGDGGHWPTS